MFYMNKDSNHHYESKAHLVSVHFVLFSILMHLTIIATIGTGIISAVSQVGRKARLKEIALVTGLQSN